MRTSWMVVVVLVVVASSAHADAPVDIEARMYMRETGQLADPLLERDRSVDEQS